MKSKIILFTILLCLTYNSKSFSQKMVFSFTSPEAATVDPTLARGVYDHRMVHMLFEGLLRIDNKGNRELAVAQKYEMSDDGKRYTFYLRKSAKWSDGSPVTAHDFVASYYRALNPQNYAAFSYMLYNIKNAKQINKSKIFNSSKLGTKAIDDYTLEFQLESPTPYFLELVTQPIFFPIPRKIVEKYGRRWAGQPFIVNNGPFVISLKLLNDKTTFVKNPHYWQKDQVKLDKVIIYTTDDQGTQLRLYKNNQAHWLTYPITASAYPEIKEDPEWIAPLYQGTFFFNFNTNKKPFSDPRVRRALNMAIDRKVICEKITQRGEIPAFHFIPSYTANYTSKNFIEENNKRAKELLAEAGYKNGKNFPPFNILYNNSDTNRKIALVVATMWKQNLGLDVKVENVEWKTYLARLYSQDYTVIRRGWIADYNDANNFLQLFHGQEEGNTWSNKEYDTALAKAKTEIDIAKREQYLQQAEKILLQQAIVIPIFFYTAQQMIKPYVKGFYPRVQNNDHGQTDIKAGNFSLIDYHPIKDIWIDFTAQKAYAKPKLIAALKGATPSAKIDVIAALSKLGGDKEIVTALIGCLEDKEPTVVNSAIQALGEIGPNAKPAVPKLLKFLNSRTYRLITLSIKALTKIAPDNPKVVSKIVFAFKSRNLGIKTIAVESIIVLGERAAAAIPNLILGLKHRNRYIRIYSAQALGEMGSKADFALPAIKALLNDKNRLVRVSVEKVVKKMQSKENK